LILIVIKRSNKVSGQLPQACLAWSPSEARGKQVEGRGLTRRWRFGQPVT